MGESYTKSITISLIIDNDNNITCKNESTGVVIHINDKKINAYDIYNLLDYKKGNTYTVTNNFDSVADKANKEYCRVIDTIMQEIIKEVNEMPE